MATTRNSSTAAPITLIAVEGVPRNLEAMIPAKNTAAIVASTHAVRKVGVEWFSGVPLGLAKSGWAFIVERKA